LPAFLRVAFIQKSLRLLFLCFLVRKRKIKKNVMAFDNPDSFLPPLSDPAFPYGEYQDLLSHKKYKEAKAVLLELKQGGLISSKEYTLHHKEVIALMKKKK
jgi:hypothetical protein